MIAKIVFFINRQGISVCHLSSVSGSFLPGILRQLIFIKTYYFLFYNLT
jgi:hypothetical protein